MRGQRSSTAPTTQNRIEGRMTERRCQSIAREKLLLAETLSGVDERSETGAHEEIGAGFGNRRRRNDGSKDYRCGGEKAEKNTHIRGIS